MTRRGKNGATSAASLAVRIRLRLLAVDDDDDDVASSSSCSVPPGSPPARRSGATAEDLQQSSEEHEDPMLCDKTLMMEGRPVTPLALSRWI